MTGSFTLRATAASIGPTLPRRSSAIGAGSRASIRRRIPPAPPTLPSIAIKLDDFRPYFFKTADYGKTWTKITNGLPDNSYAQVVREDPKRKGLLYAGTENGVYISFDDGGHWQSLKLNLPTTPVHDLTIKGDDLVVATYGRAFWVLDDIASLAPDDRG